MSLLLDSARDVRLVIDRDIAEAAAFCCPDGTRTGYIRMSTADVLEKLIPYTGHTYEVIAI